MIQVHNYNRRKCLTDESPKLESGKTASPSDHSTSLKHPSEDSLYRRHPPACHTFLSVRNLHTFAILAAKLPPVERTLDTVAHHATSDPQVGPEVGAVGVHHVGLPIVPPEHRHLLPWSRDKIESGH